MPDQNQDRPLCTCPDGLEFNNPTGHSGTCPKGFSLWMDPLFKIAAAEPFVMPDDLLTRTITKMPAGHGSMANIRKIVAVAGKSFSQVVLAGLMPEEVKGIPIVRPHGIEYIPAPWLSASDDGHTIVVLDGWDRATVLTRLEALKLMYAHSKLLATVEQR